MLKKNSSFLLFLLVLGLFGDQAFAKSENFDFSLGTLGFFDDNVLLNNARKKADFANALSPTASFKLIEKDALLSTAFSPTFWFYLDQAKLNYQSYDLQNEVRYRVNKNWNVQLNNHNRWDSVAFLAGGPVGAVGRFRYRTNDLAPQWTFQSEKGTQVTGSYTRDWVFFAQDEVQDSTSNVFALKGSQAVTSLFSVISDVQYKNKNYQDGPETEAEAGTGTGTKTGIFLWDAGLAWKPVMRLSGEAKIGYEHVDPRGLEKENQLYYAAAVTYQISRQTTLSYTSVFETLAVDVVTRPLRQWTSETSMAHQLTKNTRIAGSLAFLLGHFQSPRANQDTVRVSVDLEHAFSSYLSGRLGYAFEKMVSQAFDSYRRNLVYLGLTLKV